MAEEKELRRYILQRFFITLIAVGIAQGLINILFSFVIGPFLIELLELDMIGQGVNASDMALIAFELSLLFLLRIVSPNASFFLSGLFEKILKNIVHSNVSIADLYKKSSEIVGIKGGLYPLLAFLCCAVCVIIWLLPYVIAALSFSHTVSKRFRLLEERRAQKDKENTQQRNLLLSDVAHDIKTPITTIAGFSQALKDGTVEQEKKQDYLESIYEKSMKTVELVTLLFEYVKLESEGYELHKTTEDIYELLRGCIANSYTDFEDKNMAVFLDIPEEKEYLRVDRIQLERAINNILINAWKHNPPNTNIWIRASAFERRILIQISDDGNLIETETAKHLFDPFVQGDKSRTGNKGSGLGLSITRKIIEMHKGQIRLVQFTKESQIKKAFEIYLNKEDNLRSPKDKNK